MIFPRLTNAEPLSFVQDLPALKTEASAAGDPIETTEPATKDISEESEPKYRWAYDGNPGCR